MPWPLSWPIARGGMPAGRPVPCPVVVPPRALAGLPAVVVVMSPPAGAAGALALGIAWWWCHVVPVVSTCTGVTSPPVASRGYSLVVVVPVAVVPVPVVPVPVVPAVVPWRWCLWPVVPPVVCPLATGVTAPELVWPTAVDTPRCHHVGAVNTSGLQPATRPATGSPAPILPR